MITFEEIRDQVHAAKELNPETVGVVTFQLESTLGAHTAVQRVIEWGRIVLGLELESGTAGSWLSKTTYVRVRGEARTLQIFLDEIALLDS